MADIKNTYVASADVTITLAALASDTNLLAGRSSVVVDNTVNKYIDYFVAGTIKLGTSPTDAKTVEVWAWAPRDDTPTYFDTIDGTDANKTITNRDILASFMRLVASVPTKNTTGFVCPFGPVSVASLFGGVCPPKFGFFVVHNTGVALDSTGGNHAIKLTGVYASAS